MTTFEIKYFKKKHQERVSLVKAIVHYDAAYDLKTAKDALDGMLDGIPITCNVEDKKTKEFKILMDSFNLEYRIK